MGELLWLHSGGAFNKEPENDLGNYPSRFEISGEPPDEPNVMDNLFDDVMPEEAASGLIDYRCFYLWNPNTKAAITDVQIELTQCQECQPSSVIYHGSVLTNEVQIIEFHCDGFESVPDDGGYVIFDTSFGAPFTVFWHGDWNTFGDDLQTRLREQPWCDEVTVTQTATATFEVDFSGSAGNRDVCPIRIVQNSLLHKGTCRLNTDIYYSCDEFNGYGDSIVKTVQPIGNYVPQTGTIQIYNPLTGLWDSYDYGSHSDFEFFLENPLQFNLVGFRGSCPPIGDPNDPENWQREYPSPAYYGGYPEHNLPLPVPWGVISVPLQDKNCRICISTKTEGHPIGTIATPIKIDTEAPSGVDFTQDTILVGNLEPNQGFYWWIKRVVPPGAPPCLEHYFRLRITGTKVSWPLDTGGS